jgi:hypothetical protein
MEKPCAWRLRGSPPFAMIAPRFLFFSAASAIVPGPHHFQGSSWLPVLPFARRSEPQREARAADRAIGALAFERSEAPERLSASPSRQGLAIPRLHLNESDVLRRDGDQIPRAERRTRACHVVAGGLEQSHAPALVPRALRLRVQCQPRRDGTISISGSARRLSTRRLTHPTSRHSDEQNRAHGLRTGNRRPQHSH